LPRFEPFRAVRYNLDRVEMGQVTAPPYDVISPTQRKVWADRSPYNAVHIDLVESIPDGYEQAHCLLSQWIAGGVLSVDPQPAFYAYGMGFTDSSGTPRQTLGVVGALALSGAGDGQILPHERTLPKAKDDRLRLMRACRANLSPVWCLSLARGLTDLLTDLGPPLARCTDDEGTHHRLWAISRPALVEAISAVVGSAPVVIADGHHRYETAVTYRDEVAGDGLVSHSGPLGADLLMTLVVELADAQVGVAPIHRLVSDFDSDIDLLHSFGGNPVAVDPSIHLDDRYMAGVSEGPILITSTGRWILDPGPEVDEPDAVVIERRLPALGPHVIGFEHQVSTCLDAVADGTVGAALLLRPLTVGQIAAAASAGVRLPQKTTFFTPKPRTGMLFRQLE